jgi:hypothetical protein
MDYYQAKSIVQKKLDDMEAAGSIPLKILEDQTREYNFGWVFFYQCKDFDERVKTSPFLSGNAPFVVTKKDGIIHLTGTAEPLDFYLKEFEDY